MRTRNSDTEQDPFLSFILQVLLRRAWIILLLTAVFVAAAVGFSLMQAPVYEASSKLLVGQIPKEDRTTSLGSDIMGLQQATQTVAIAVRTRPVAEAVVRELDLQMTPDQLLKGLTVEQVQATQFIDLTYRHSDPERAQEIANVVGDVAARQVSESSAGASGIETSVWEYAETPETFVSPTPIRNGLLALGLGLMFGIGLAFVLEWLNDGWNSLEEVEQISDAPNVGAIPLFDVAISKGSN